MYAILTHGETVAIFNGRIPAEYEAFTDMIKTCIRNGWAFNVTFSHTADRII